MSDVDCNAANLSGADQLFCLLQNPFKATFQANAFWASLGSSLGFMLFVALLFSLLRPRHSVVYAPKMKYADEKHAPPAIGKGLFAWFAPVTKTKESQLVDKVGLDGTVFLRFIRMCRNIFLVLSVIGIAVLIPANTAGSYISIKDRKEALRVMTPIAIKQSALWAHVLSAYAIDVIIAFFLWRNYMAITRLRRQYFESSDYVMSLHSRTLMLTDIPTASRTDEGILRLLEGVETTERFPRTSIGRNVKELPDLIEEHEKAVRKLESVLAKYLKNPDNLPSVRPTLRPPKKYRRHNGADKVDAIDYLTGRIRELESEITHVRESIDKRNPMSYGFASYENIEEAHSVGFASRRKHPLGTTIDLAPRPTDLIWRNLPLTKKARSWKRFMNNFWILVLTVVWIAPNALIAVFLSDLSNLATVWPGFKDNFEGHHMTWSAVQGIASPALTSLVYVILPVIFRRLSIKAGDTTKTARERHVTTKLYAFFIFNNLIVFSLFSTVWTIVASVVNKRENQHLRAWDAIKEAKIIVNLMTGLANVSPFWLSWFLQRNLGAAIDLAQILSLTWFWFIRTFRHPTPRQKIEWTAPPPFEYAVYYNYFLFYATVALSFVTLQPLILPITAFYFAVDYWMKKYLLLYIFVTKNESGGQHWRVIFNRLIFAVILSNFIVALVVKANGSWTQVFCMVPLPILMGVFKWYCSRTFDRQNTYYTKATLKDPEGLTDPGRKSRQNDRVATRFGHPALYQRLITPMVYEKARHVLPQVYRGRLNADGAPGADFSDIAMDTMSQSHPGKAAHFAPTGPKDLFEVVPDSQLDFAHFKDRAEFAEEHGGDGAMYGRPADLISERSGTPRSFFRSGGDSNSSSRASSLGKEQPRNHSEFEELHAAYRNGGDLRAPGFHGTSAGRGNDFYLTRNESERNLLTSAQPVGLGGAYEEAGVGSEQYGLEGWQAGGSGYVGVPGAETPDEGMGYDSYRGRR